MQELLNRHPAIHFIGFEPFDHYRFRQHGADSLMLPRLLKLLFAGDRAEFCKQIERTGLPVAGVELGKTQAFKLRLATHITKHPELKPELLALFQRFNVHLFFVQRKCRLLQQLSAYRGHLQFDLKRGEKTIDELRVRIPVDVRKLRKQIDYDGWYRKKHVSLFNQTHNANPQLSSWLYYEDFLYRKREFLCACLQTLGLSREPKLIDEILAQSDSFRKVHSDRVEDIVENWDEVRREFPEQFEEYLQVREAYGLEVA